MKTPKTIIFTFTIALLALWALAEPENEISPKPTVNDLVSADPTQSEKVYKAFLKEQSQLRQALIEKVKAGFPLKEHAGSTVADALRPPEERKVLHAADYSIRLLGELRAPEGVPVLMDALTLPASTASGVNLAEESLVKIGLPSVEPLLAKIPKADSDYIFVVCVRGLKRILGSAELKRRLTALQDAQPTDAQKTPYRVAADVAELNLDFWSNHQMWKQVKQVFEKYNFYPKPVQK